MYAAGDVSGAHFNPAVTLGFVAARRSFPRPPGGLYILAQCVGALAASFVPAAFLFPQRLNARRPPCRVTATMAQSFLLELLLTFFLMFVILSVSTGAKEKGMMAGVAVRAVIAVEAAFCSPEPICGRFDEPSSFPGSGRGGRPARIHLWLYLTAPTAGALLAVSVAACRCVQERPGLLPAIGQVEGDLHMKRVLFSSASRTATAAKWRRRSPASTGPARWRLTAPARGRRAASTPRPSRRWAS